MGVLDEFQKIVRKRRFVINITIAALVLIFLSAFLAMTVAWNLRNLRFAQVDRTKRLKGQLLTAAIISAISSVFVILAALLRLTAHSKASVVPLSLIMLVLGLGLGGISFCLFSVYARAGSLQPQKQARYLKAITGMGIISLITVLFTMLYSIGFSRETKELILQ